MISFYSSINDHWLQTQHARVGFFVLKHFVKGLNFKWMQFIPTMSILSLTPNYILDCIFSNLQLDTCIFRTAQFHFFPSLEFSYKLIKFLLQPMERARLLKCFILQQSGIKTQYLRRLWMTGNTDNEIGNMFLESS